MRFVALMDGFVIAFTAYYLKYSIGCSEQLTIFIGLHVHLIAYILFLPKQISRFLVPS